MNRLAKCGSVGDQGDGVNTVGESGNNEAWMADKRVESMVRSRSFMFNGKLKLILRRGIRMWRSV